MRLRKGFVNVEKALFGGLKLKIPTLLFVEKMRTQSRFNVSFASVLVVIVIPLALLHVINLLSLL